MTVVGLDRGDTTFADAEHWAYDLVAALGVDGVVGCTHLVRVPTPHVAVSLALPEGAAASAAALLPAPDAVLAEPAAAACAAHAERVAGRAFVYPGRDALTGSLTVARLLAASAIEHVHVLGGAAAGPDTVVDTRDFVRPQWKDGRLTLVTTPAPGGRIAPFELRDQIPCCADHGQLS